MMEKEKEKTMNIYQRMSEVSKEIGTVAKNLNVVNYKAVSDPDILRAVRDAENKFGLYSYQHNIEIVRDEIINIGKNSQFWVRFKVTMRIVNLDNTSEFIDVIGYGDGLDYGDKACGKGATYANKYALMKAYKIPTGDDPDEKKSVEQKIELQNEKATAEQIAIMEQFPVEKIESMIKFYNIKSLTEMTKRNAEACIAKMSKKMEAKDDSKV